LQTHISLYSSWADAGGEIKLWILHFILELDVLTANFAYAVYIRLCVRLSPSSPPHSLPSHPLLPFPPFSFSFSFSLTVSYTPSMNLHIPSHCSVFTVSVVSARLESGLLVLLHVKSPYSSAYSSALRLVHMVRQ